MSSNALASRNDSSSHQIRRRLSRWLSRTMSKYGSEPKPPAPLPSLRRQLTGPSDDFPRESQQKSSLFTRLPPELRRDILLCAFGLRTIHMHLSLDHPMPEHVNTGTNLDRTGAHGEFTRLRDVSAPRQWLWRSCDCHRNLPWFQNPHACWLDRLWHRPDFDRCLESDVVQCGIWLGWRSAKCRVGALGWLLSCRQAYDEGIDLLYRTNSFHLSGEHLLARLPDYIVPTRLAQMSSFEVVLPLSGTRDEAPFQPWSATLPVLLNTLARSTGVKRLFLCLQCPQLFGKIADHVDVSRVLAAIDEFVRVSDAELVVLQMDEKALRQLIDNAPTRKEPEPAKTTRSLYAYRMWRSVDGDAENVKIEKRQCCVSRVHAPLQDPASPERGRSRGYWMLEKYQERPIVCTLL